MGECSVWHENRVRNYFALISGSVKIVFIQGIRRSIHIIEMLGILIANDA